MSKSESIEYLQSDSFSLIFPLPFRILFLIFIGLLLYGLVLHSLDSFNLQFDLLFENTIDQQPQQPPPPQQDESHLPLTFNPQSSQSHSQINQFPKPFHLKSSSSSPERNRHLFSKLSTISSNHSTLSLSSTTTSSTKLYTPIYYSALSIGLLTLIGLILFRFLTNGNNPILVSNLSSIPLLWLTLMMILSISSNSGLLVSSCLPFQAKFKSQRRQFRQSLYRIIFGTLNDPPVFQDILLADVLISYARVLGDLWLSVCLSTVAKHGLATQSNQVRCYKNLMVPLITSLPYAFRLRQCLAEYYSRTSPNPRRSLLNALKYATAFPMIGLSVFMVNSPASDDAPELDQESSRSMKPSMTSIPASYQFWLLSILINSLYSFWWDVTNDWSFALLRPTAWSSPSLKLSINGSRSPPPPSITGLNLMLRFTWLIRLIGPLREPSEWIGFGLEVFEIFRRSGWCFLRLETEWIKQIKLDQGSETGLQAEEEEEDRGLGVGLDGLMDEDLEEGLDEEVGLGNKRGIHPDQQFGIGNGIGSGSGVGIGIGIGKNENELQDRKEDRIELDESLILMVGVEDSVLCKIQCYL
ncbi:uncharacterized protein MELLADRAFT_115571 [Melampsora larici-populina 98AG31]|uniref:EXS domain-containing protein n=1 Tax=Melampsora larici-populina (strain 98AG31 / pathotype 3-4-7) TaxID=747676 RepID=F4RBQ8_MELLP|nr:uncharacterized protein MELLADRAFT_115571 [Melampsora larici-populina 98AG31]EGG10296.1 hypothetical protein MELLADRAFT_115571 [Melampsora larici-populina 98AG31]